MVRKESHAIAMGTIQEDTSPSFIRQRGLLDQNATVAPNASLSFFTPPSARKRWRWWDYMAVLFVCIAFIEIIILITNAILLSLASPPVTFSKNMPSFFFINVISSYTNLIVSYMKSDSKLPQDFV